MIQPVAKLHFVERYCNPADGWQVFVDIDPSEEGRTGSARISPEAQARYARTVAEAPKAIKELMRLGACVGQRKEGWISCFGTTLIQPQGDRDIIAVNRARRHLWVVEVEGDSGGQPEGKIYRALGQLLCAVSETTLSGYERFLTIVVYGEKAANHLARACAASQLGISGLVIGATPDADQWIFGEPPSRIG